MKTEYLHVEDPHTIERAVQLLATGRLVAFPTDTLYGIGADPFSEAAVEALYRAKERPLKKGIPILLADLSDLDKVAHDVPALANNLLRRFWPGPLTLIVPRRRALPANISPNENVAVRIPDHDVARAIIRAAGGALATTSANRSGEQPARDAEEALQALKGLVSAVIDGGPVAVGVASTIVDCTVDPPLIVRQGSLSAKTLSLGTV